MQWPNTEDIIDSPFVLTQGKSPDKQAAGHRPGYQRPQGMHDIGAGTDGNQAGQRTVMHKTRVISTGKQCSQNPADHGHKGIHRHQPGYGINGLGRHDIKAEPTDGQHPGSQRQKWNAGRRVGEHFTTLAIATVTMPQQNYRTHRQPASHGMHDHTAGEVMKGRPESGLEPVLDAEVTIPDDALKKGINQGNDYKGGCQLRIKSGAFGNTAGNDRGNRRSEGQQEKELHQFVAVLLAQGFSAFQKAHAVGDTVADKEICNGRYRKIGNNLYQCIDLVFLADRPDFQKRKAGMHCQY